MMLPLIEKGAQDDRNFVKKGVSWACARSGDETCRFTRRRRCGPATGGVERSRVPMGG